MAEESAVKVFVRLRPVIEREECASSERKEPVQVFWKTDKKLIHQIDDGSSTKSFTFDRVFTAEETTNQVYQDIAKPLVVSTVEGYNGTIFAYGQTSSGKTFTMMGNDHVPGIIPLAVDDVFETIKKCPKKEFLLRVSYMEIYNETVTDLLVDKWKRKPLEVRETINKTIYVADLTEELVTSSAQVLAWIRKGEKNRHYGKTEMNQRSSRSHTVFRMILESRERSDLASGENADGAIIVSHLNLVDLAGSERASQTGAEGTRLKEGCNINRSLFTLGQVIKKLGEESQRNFINYRDSKLTRILQNSLGGNAKTVILCTITTASLDETLRTLQFASTAKKMKNDPHVTEVSDDGALLKRYRNEIVDLKRRLQEVSSETQTTVTEKEVLAQLLQEKHQLQVEQEDRIKNLTKLLVTSNNLTRVQRLPKRRVTWGGKMLHLASEDRPSARNIADSFSLKRKADSSCVMELVEEDEDFCGSWEIPDETSEDASETQDFVTIRSFGNRSAERVSELELQLDTVGQQKQQALDQILAMEEKAAEVDLRLKNEAQQKAQAMEKVEMLELSMAELKRQLEEQNDNQLKSDQQPEIELAEIVQHCEILAIEKDMVESERDHLKQELGIAVEQTQKLEKDKAALEHELKEKVELAEFVSLEEKFRKDNEVAMQNKISSLEKAIDSRELQYLELEKHVETLSEELKKKTKIADDLEDMCGKDMAEEVAKLRLSLDDAEALGRETKKEWAVLRSENIALEELKTTLSLSHEKMEAEVNTLRVQLETEKSNFRKMQADLQKELNIVFNENMKLMSLLDGKVPRNTMDSVELERTVTNLKKELAASQEAGGILRAQLEELRSLQAPPYDVNNLEKQISVEEMEKQESVVAMLTAERDQLRMDLQENIDMTIENQAELRTALGRIVTLKQRIKELEDSRTSNLGNPFDDMTAELETLQTQKTENQAALMMAQEKIRLLQEEVNLLMNENRDAGESKNQIQRLAEELECVNAERDNIQSEMEKLVCQFTSLIEEKDQLHGQLEVQRQETSQLRAELELMAETHHLEIKILSGELETVKAEKDALCLNKEAGHQAFMEETQKLLARMKFLSEERDQLLKTVEELRKDKIQLKTEVEQNKDKNFQKTESHAEMAQEKIRFLQEEVDLLVNENASKSQELQKQIQRLTEELECVIAERDNIQSEMEKLVCQVTSLSEERNQLHDQLELLRQESSQLRAELEVMAGTHHLETEKQAELMMAQEKIRLLQEEVNLLMNENRDVGESKNQRLAEELECVTAERDNIQSEMEKLVCQVTSLSEERNQLHDQLEVLRQESSQLRAELEVMAATHHLEKTEKQAELVIAQEKIRHLQEEVNLLVNENRDFGESKNQIQRLAEELECVTMKRDNIQSEMEKLVCQVTSLSEERNQLHEQLEVLRQETSQLRVELEVMSGTHHLEVKESQNLLQSLLDEIEELKQKNCNLVKVTEKKEFDLKESTTESQTELKMAQEKLRFLQEEVDLLMNENASKSQELQNQIQRLTEELECVTAERDNNQSEMEKLVCQVTSLNEEKDQLHGQLEVQRQETSQLRAELEVMAGTHHLELQQLAEQLKTFKENETVAQAEAMASQQLLVEPNATISVANEKLRSCDWDLMVSGVTASSRLHDLTLRLQELFGRFQQFIDKASQPHAAFKRGALVAECFLSDKDYSSFPQDTQRAHDILCELGQKNLRALNNINDAIVGKAKQYKMFFQELVRIDVSVFKEWCSQDVLRCRASSPKDMDCCSDQEHRLAELEKKRQLYVQKMGDILENLGAGLYSYRSEVSAEVRERSRFFTQMEDEHDRPPLVVSRLHPIFCAEVDGRSALMQRRERILQGIIDDRHVRCEELQQLNAQAQFQLEKEKSKCAVLQQKLGEAPARSELSLLCNNQELLHQSEEKIKALWLQNKKLEEAQLKSNSYKMAVQQLERQLLESQAQVEEQKNNIKTLKSQLQESEALWQKNKKLEEAPQKSSSYKMAVEQLETELLESRAQVEEQKKDINTLKSQLHESEKRESPSAAELQKAQAQLYMKEMELSVAYDKHQQEIQRMTTVLHTKEELVRRLKESLRELQHQGEVSFLQGEELHERLINPRGLNKHRAVVQNGALEDEVKQLQTKIAQLENVISSLQADVTKWKNRAVKLKLKAKEDVKSALSCTPTKHGLPVCPQSPKKFPFAPQRGLDSPKTQLDSPRVLLLDSPKSKFFDKAANDNILSRTFPRGFFDNSSLGISADVSGVPDGESADTNANSDGCQSQPLDDGPENCITQ
ncbi:centromere-associated protein E isoform X3 [Festucalex cinctus]